MFLLDQFHELYREILRLRAKVSQGGWVFDAGRDASAGTGGAPDTAPTAVWRALLTLMERQAEEAGRSGGDFAVEVYGRARFAMVALADEVFLHLDWAGRETWRDHLLEARLFDTHSAGEELFVRMDRLLQHRNAVDGELARVYLAVLALGFQGKYRGRPDGERELEKYRRRLFRFIFGRDPEILVASGKDGGGVAEGGERLVPQACAFTLSEATRSTLPHLKPWLWAVVVLTVLWISGGHLLWRNTVAGLQPLVDEILSPAASTSVTAATPATPAIPGEAGR